MVKLKITHNLDEAELEDALEKALRGLRSYTEPDRDLPDKLAKEISSEANQLFGKIIQNMLSEIQDVLNKN